MEANKGEWKLKGIRVRFMEYGENKGKYEGSVTFFNGNEESFSFRIKPEMAQNYIALIADDLVKGAENLGSDLLKSLKLK